MTTTDSSWQLVGNVKELQQKSCQRLKAVTRGVANEASVIDSTTASVEPAAVASSTLFREADHRDLVLIYVQRSDRFYAMEAACAHMGGPLYSGDIEDCGDKTRIVCPWHGIAFDVQTGLSDIGLPQTTYDVKIENGKVFVNYACELATES